MYKKYKYGTVDIRTETTKEAKRHSKEKENRRKAATRGNQPRQCLPGKEGVLLNDKDDNAVLLERHLQKIEFHGDAPITPQYQTEEVQQAAQLHQHIEAH
jgi:hypothetical protein